MTNERLGRIMKANFYRETAAIFLEMARQLEEDKDNVVTLEIVK